MTISQIASELIRNEEQKLQRDEEIIQMLTEINNGVETAENWFLRQALLFIEQDGFNVSAYSLNWCATNQESEPDAPIHLWFLVFIKEENEFILEVNKNRNPAVVAKKWSKTKTGRITTRRVSHIKDAVNQ